MEMLDHCQLAYLNEQIQIIFSPAYQNGEHAGGVKGFHIVDDRDGHDNMF